MKSARKGVLVFTNCGCVNLAIIVSILVLYSKDPVLLTLLSVTALLTLNLIFPFGMAGLRFTYFTIVTLEPSAQSRIGTKFDCEKSVDSSNCFLAK